MIIKAEQISNEGKKSHIFTNEKSNEPIAETLTFQNSLQRVGLTIRFSNGNDYILFGDIAENAQGLHNPNNLFSATDLNALSERSKVSLFDARNVKLGEIKPIVEGKVGLSVEYKVFDFRNEKFYLYEIEKTLKGKFFFIYLNDNEVVAAVHMKKVSVNHYHNYEIYIKDTKYLDMAVLFLTYMDNRNYLMDWNFGTATVDIDAGIAIQSKKIREKYNPDFIKQVKAMN